MTRSRDHDVLFRPARRQIPILTAADWPYPVHTVFNAGRDASRRRYDAAALSRRRSPRALAPVRRALGERRRRLGHRREPTLRPDPEHYPEELWGIEDPRITFVEELGKYAIAYTAFSKGGPGVALALTEDFRRFERCGLIMQPDDKDAALLPRRIDGNFALIHRPMTDSGAHVWMSLSPDLTQLGQPQARPPGAQGMPGGTRTRWAYRRRLIETPRGWLMLYHGVRHTAAGCLYRLGVALFALDQPETCLARGDSWIFGPEMPYERDGDVGNVVFPCGYTVGADGDTLNLYYGAADTSMGLATGSIKALLGWLDAHSKG